MKKSYDIAAYIWPAYTGREPRTRMFWPEGMGEWQSVRSCKGKFEGDTWPRKPLWGYVDEADPYVMEMEINAAADHGVNVFIYDWYWFDRRPFLEQCLNEGYLKARNNHRVKFMLMWANHDALHNWDKRLSETEMWLDVLWRGDVDEVTFSEICDRLITKYFNHPNYYCIDGKPVFMIYDLNNLVKGLGGVEKTTKQIAMFKERCVNAGLKGLHLQLKLACNDGELTPYSEYAKQLGFDSITSYQFGEMTDINRDYTEVAKDIAALWEEWNNNYDLPYFPLVSIGWDNSPRFATTRRFGTTTNSSPEKFTDMLQKAKEYIDNHDLPARFITVNSWNEWTEGSYLEPDNVDGYGYLEAVKKVFVEEN